MTNVLFKIVLSTLWIVISCKREDAYKNKINALTTSMAQQQFLEKLWENDQEIRDRKTEIQSRNSSNLTTQKKINEEMRAGDDSRLQQLEYYLSVHGHPQIGLHGKKAAMTPWLLVHHSGTLEARERNFDYLYKAYIQGDLSESQFSLYLYRWHHYRFGKGYRHKAGSAPEAERIGCMMEALNL